MTIANFKLALGKFDLVAQRFQCFLENSFFGGAAMVHVGGLGSEDVG